MNQSQLSAPQQRVRLDYIDALRGLAALMVLICHTTGIDPSLSISTHAASILESFKYGVQLFFVISAFTIFYSLNHSDAGTYNFFIRRFFRIAPLYLVAVLTYGIMYRSEEIGLIINALFLHGFSPRYINTVVPGGWSIGVEMLFYCMVPVLFRYIRNVRSALYLFSIALLISFSLFYVYRKFMPSTPDLESFIYFWLPNQFPAFVIGMLVYFLTFRAEGFRRESLFFPVTLLSLLVMASILLKYQVFGEHIVFAAASGTFIIFLKYRPFPLLVNPFTLFLGKISYSLYLSQYAAMYLLQETGLYSVSAPTTRASTYLNFSSNLLCFFVVTAILSYLLFYIIELPFQRLGRRFLIEKATMESLPINFSGKSSEVQYTSPSKTF